MDALGAPGRRYVRAPAIRIPDASIVMCNETGRYVMYRSDRYGFNAPDSQWEIPPEVALVGDSFVEGWCVEPQDSFAGLVRRAIPATLNVGYSGHGPLADLGTVREYVEPRRPRHVVWFFYEGNDLSIDLPREVGSDILRKELEPDFTQHLEDHSKAVGDEMRRIIDGQLADLVEPTNPYRPLAAIARLRLARQVVKRVLERTTASPGPPPPLRELHDVLAEA